MRNKKGQFIKGQRASRKTEFKKGQHWRKRKPFWDKEWLRYEYEERQQPVEEIAKQFNVTENAIYFWIKKHGIKTRSMSEIRRDKHWGSKGSANRMYGKRGSQNPNWKGGITAERQAFYQTPDWAKAVKAVWRRDKGICQRCGLKAEGLYRGVRFHIHHVAPFEIREKRADKNNLVLLCISCHRWVHSKKNKKRRWCQE